MIKILQGFVTNSYSGVSQYIYNMYLYHDEIKFHYDFLYLHTKPYYASSFEAQGSGFYKTPRIWNFYQYYSFMRLLYDKNHYDYIYLNMSFCNCIPVILCRLAGFPRIVCHAHANGFENMGTIKKILIYLYHNLSKMILKLIKIDIYFSCSKEAANFMFGNNKTIMAKNAIDISRYVFNKTVRDKVREKLNISQNTFVIGHVGRFVKTKNHMYLVDVLQQILLKHPDSILLLVGDGVEKAKVEEYVRNVSLQSKVKFLGNRDDVDKLLQAMDVFVMPSSFEGFGMACLEGQASGLPCIISETIPKSVAITPLVKYLSIYIHPKIWAEEILKCRTKARIDYSKLIINKGFNLEEEVRKIEDILEKIIERR